jgi:hypothetical protein
LRHDLPLRRAQCRMTLAAWPDVLIDLLVEYCRASYWTH